MASGSRALTAACVLLSGLGVMTQTLHPTSVGLYPQAASPHSCAAPLPPHDAAWRARRPHPTLRSPTQSLIWIVRPLGLVVVTLTDMQLVWVTDTKTMHQQFDRLRHPHSLHVISRPHD
jgi:hypothetical protein